MTYGNGLGNGGQGFRKQFSEKLETERLPVLRHDIDSRRSERFQRGKEISHRRENTRGKQTFGIFEI